MCKEYVKPIRHTKLVFLHLVGPARKQAYSICLFSQKTSFSHQFIEGPGEELCRLLGLESEEYCPSMSSTDRKSKPSLAQGRPPEPESEKFGKNSPSNCENASPLPRYSSSGVLKTEVGSKPRASSPGSGKQGDTHAHAWGDALRPVPGEENERRTRTGEGDRQPVHLR